ncbi:hypothetical protein Pmani_004074 [Petrolisthes manimaculis]|uniref:Uncharacterized protein n=1 Tax=Petrolisthes manimaculis TaxID=1843537 RepID=A0AAE1QFM5_9EUCA|nr:hypothetical protein Pmani_004074 [Petrolisthes manimaculis]
MVARPSHSPNSGKPWHTSSRISSNWEPCRVSSRITSNCCCEMLSFGVMLQLVKLAVGKTCRRMVFLRDCTAGRTRDARHSVTSCS